MKKGKEEWVRQELIYHMVNVLGYPRHTLKKEVALSNLEHLKGKKVPLRRLDLLCFAKFGDSTDSLKPLLLVECKAHKLNTQAFEQLCGYNHWVKAPFIALSNFYETIMGSWSQKQKRYLLTQQLLPYHALQQYCTESITS